MILSFSCSLPLFALIGATGAGPQAGPLPQQAGIRPPERLHSARLGFRSDSEETKALLALDAAGRVTKELVTHGETPVFGPGERVALVSRQSQNALREVRMVNARLEVTARFSIGAERELHLGAERIAVIQREEHMAGIPFEVDFLDASGTPLGNFSQGDRTLLEVRAQEDGHWSTSSHDAEGLMHVHLFDANGVFMWELDSGATIDPAVVTSPASELTAVGIFSEGKSSSRLELVDAAGRSVVSAVVPRFRAAFFSPAGNQLALVGRDSLSLVRASDAKVLWTHAFDGSPARGSSVAFSSDGRDILAAAVDFDRNGDPRRASLVRLNARDGSFEDAASFAAPVRHGLSVLQLQPEPEGGWHLVTPDGHWSIDA